MLFIFFILYGIYHLVKTFTYLKIGRTFIRHGFNSKYTYNDIKKVELLMADDELVDAYSNLFIKK